MLKSIKAGFVTDTEIKEDPFLHRRIIITTALLVFTTLTFAVFVLINLDHENYILPLVNFIFAISTAPALYSLIVKKILIFLPIFPLPYSSLS